VAINKFWMNARSRFGLKFVPAHNSYRQCLSALRKNEIIAFVLDQNMIDTEGIFVDFFGKKACTSPGLAYMSAQSGAAVVPVFMIRLENGRHLIKAAAPIPPPPDRKPETIHAYTQLYTKVIEDVVREYPAQWTWIHRRWRTTPKYEKEI
jgi:KDO2-lipid IV(A) lauroyltransferase